MNPTDNLKKMGLTLPPPAKPAFNYVPVAIQGELAFVSGQLPWDNGEIKTVGSLGATVSVDQGKEAARICALQSLACLAQALGSIDRIARIVKLTGFVQSAPNFHQQPSVIDAASELMIEVFGEDGRHARSAIGVGALPRDAPVELEVIVAIHPR
jgi:enamine deaminase RidA (YjgF/YER057c/UK114 family)